MEAVKPLRIDFTLHFWTTLSQFLALVGGSTFLWHTYKWIRKVGEACVELLDEHREMYGWYQTAKTKIL